MQDHLEPKPEKSLRQEPFPVGTVGKLHGLAGELKIHLKLSDKDLLRGVETLIGEFADGRVRKLEVERIHVQDSHALLTVKGITNREEAAALLGVKLSVERDELPPLREGEYFLGDLVGYTVVSEDGQDIGAVAAAWDMPANDVLQVMDDGREVLIPLVSEVVLEIDHASRRLVVAVLEGLLH